MINKQKYGNILVVHRFVAGKCGTPAYELGLLYILANRLLKSHNLYIIMIRRKE